MSKYFWRMYSDINYNFIWPNMFLMSFRILQQPLTLEEIQSVNFCLVLLRNVLHIPERPSLRPPPMPSSSRTWNVCDYTSDNSQQNQIVCNLFAQGLGPLLLKLLDCPQKVLIAISLLKPHIMQKCIWNIGRMDGDDHTGHVRSFQRSKRREYKEPIDHRERYRYLWNVRGRWQMQRLVWWRINFFIQY